ncbi:hypothetical protein FCM35_KLT22094 [Carex littledalei]|uniref:Uncharacterized protein n=1 Tax=Carex littledalei TaxID=544730 RepID=A0A833QKW7_9POAL|nr:hypothetical protein FCM35_KLT22094 [Carex littledalei]
MLLVRGSNKAPCRYGARGDVRSSPPLAAPGHARRPHTWAHRTSRFGGPMSASFCPEATERGWASNAREAGVPSGGSLGRNLRSKTRWFTGFCNSHHVSHFATFFIDARAEISVAESHTFFPSASATGAATERLAGASARSRVPWRHPAPYSGQRPTRPEGEREEAGGGRGGGERLPGSNLSRVQRSCFSRGNGNDPSAGSPTETLLRLLLPLNDKKGQQISPRDDFATRDRVEPHRQPITRIPTTTHSVTGGTVKRQPHVRLAAPKVQGARHAEQVQNNSYDATVLDTLHQRPQHRRPSQNDLETTDVQTPRSIPFLPGVSALDAPLHRVSPRFARGVSTLRRPASVFCGGVSTLRRPAQTRLCGASPRLDAPLNPLLRGASPRLDAPLACFAGASPRLDAPLKHGCAGRLHA